jgi:hypothetical protein
VWTSPPVKHAGRAGRDVPLAVGWDDRGALTALEAEERGGARAFVSVPVGPGVVPGCQLRCDSGLPACNARGGVRGRLSGTRRARQCPLCFRYRALS